jgi:hypothetical protein
MGALHTRGTEQLFFADADTCARFKSLERQWRSMVAQAHDGYNARRLAETDHRNVWRTLKQHHAH